MPSAPQQPEASLSGIRDNHRRGIMEKFLRKKIQPDCRLSVVSAYFTIYAYDVLREHLDQIEYLDFLLGEPRFISSLEPDKTQTKAFVIDGATRDHLVRGDHKSAELDRQITRSNRLRQSTLGSAFADKL